MADRDWTSPEGRAELRRLLEGATSPEWEYGPDGRIEHSDGGAIAYVAEHANIRTMQRHGEDHCSADGRLIAAARTALPALLDRVDALETPLMQLLSEEGAVIVHPGTDEYNVRLDLPADLWDDLCSLIQTRD